MLQMSEQVYVLECTVSDQQAEAKRQKNLEGTVASLVMGISPTNLLQLTDIVVYKNLGHQLNLGLNFCRQFKARLNYEGDQPCIEIQGEKYSLVNSVAAEKGGEEREQPLCFTKTILTPQACEGGEVRCPPRLSNL